MSLRRKLFYGFTLTVVAVLLLLPATGWLARLQLLPFTTSAGPNLLMDYDNKSLEKNFARESDRAIARSGRNFDLEFARATGVIFDDNAVKRLDRLSGLYREHPGNPVVISALLKALTVHDVKVGREEEALLSHPDRRKNFPAATNKKQDPAQVVRFIALAEAGEKLEPQNAFFPTMAAWGYFAARKDDAAVAAWIRAGEKPKWDDHYGDEIRAKWKLQRAINRGSETGALARMSSMAGILLPHYAGIRASARMAAVTAFQAELRGEKEKGFAIRQASRRIGQTMQEECKTYIGNLVGKAIVALATSRAGGAEVVDNPYKGTGASERWMKERQARYTQYLLSIGHPEEAAAYAKAIADGEFLKGLFTRANPKTYWGFEAKTYQLFGGWFANFLLIAGVLFSLVFAGIFKLAYRFSPRLQKGEPLQKSAKWGLFTGIVSPILGGAISLFAMGAWLEPYSGMELFAAAAVILALLVVVPPVLLRLSMREIGHGLLVMLATWGSFAALIGAGMFCVQFAQGIISAIGLFSYSGEGSSDGAVDVVKVVTPWVIGAAVLSVPLGLLLLFGIFSRILKVPFAAGVTRGMRAMAVPLACVLTLVWCGTLFYTLRHEHAAIAEMEQMATRGEMQYLKQFESKKTGI